MSTDPIDFVIPWVDDADKEWRKKYKKYKHDEANDEARYRDWDILKYWFRGVEKYAPWVNKIHFITCGQKPDWLDETNPKLNLVNHVDYIPEKYLPTFSSHTIELHLSKIQGLSDKIVYFNDDMFLINDVSKNDFFVNDLPCDMATLYPNSVNGEDTQFDHILLNDAEFFEKNFDIKKVIQKNKNGWLNLKYGKNLLKTLCLLPFPAFPGIMLLHQPQSLVKETLIEVEANAKELIDKTSRHKFRTSEDINQYIFRYWQLGKGKFCPYNILKRGKYFPIEPNTDYQGILNSKYKIVCLNDGNKDIDFDLEKKRLVSAFEKKLPNKSSFEK